MEKQKMNHLEKPEGWSHETSGEGYPLLLYLEEDGKGVDWNQEKYPCFFWQVTVNQGTEHMDIAERMRELVKTYPIDETRIYCAGEAGNDRRRAAGTEGGSGLDVFQKQTGGLPD